MRLLERVLIDVIGRYVPDVDLQKLRVDLLQQRASLLSVNLAPAGQTPPTLLLAGVPFILAAPSTLDVLNVSFQGGLLRADASGLVVHLVQIPYHRSAGNVGVSDALARAKRTALAEAERQATGLFGTLLNKFFPLLMEKLQVSVTDVRFVVKLVSGHSLEVCLGELRTESVAYDSGRTDTNSGEGGDGGDPAVDAGGFGGSRHAMAVTNTPVAVAGDLAKDVAACNVAVCLEGKPLFRLVECLVRLRYRLGEYGVDLRVGDPLQFVVRNALIDELLALRRETGLWEGAAKYQRPKQSARDAPAAWWRYANRVIMRSGGCGHIAEDFGRSKLVRCAKYHRAHLERLNNGNRTGAATLEECRLLEEALDVETVQLLRARARMAVRAETATRFAAEDWLGWMLIGDVGTGGVDREMADDIRAAVNSLEEARANDYESIDGMLAGMTAGGAPAASAASAATAWTHAAMSVYLASVVVSFVGDEDDLRIDATMEKSRLRVELDSPFTSLEIDASVGTLSLCDGRVQYVRRLAGADSGLDSPAMPPAQAGGGGGGDGVPLVAELEPPSSASRKRRRLAPLVNICVKVFPQRTDECASAEVRIAGGAVHCDISRLSPILAAYAKLTGAGRGTDPVGGSAPVAPLVVRRADEPSDFHLPFVLVADSVATTGARSGAAGSSGLSPSSAARPSVSGEGASSDWLHKLVVHLHVVRVRLYVSSGLAVRDTGCAQRDGVLLDLSGGSVEWSPFSRDLEQGASASVVASLRACVLANDTFGGGEMAAEAGRDEESGAGGLENIVDTHGFIRTLYVGEPILPSVRVTAVARGPTVNIGCDGELTLRAWDAEVESLAVLARSVADEIETELSNDDARMSSASTSAMFPATPCTLAAWKRCATALDEVASARAVPAVSQTVRLSIPCFRVVGLLGAESPATVALLSVRGLCCEWDTTPHSNASLAFRDLSLSDSRSDGVLRVGPADGRSNVGLSIVSAVDEGPAESARAPGEAARACEKTKVSVGSVDVCLSPASVLRLTRYVCQVIGLVSTAFESAEAAPASGVVKSVNGGEAVAAVSGSETAGPHRVECGIHLLRVRVRAADFEATATAGGIFVTGAASSWEGHVDTVELVDTGGTSGLHCHVMSRRCAADVTGPAVHSVRFNARANRLSLFVSSVSVVILRSFVDELVTCVTSLTRDVLEAIEPTYVILRNAAPRSDGGGRAVDDGTLSHVDVTGSHVLVAVPVSPVDSFTAGLDLQHVSVTWSPSLLSVSGRRIAILTTFAATPPRPPQQNCHRVVPAFDIDVSLVVSNDEVPGTEAAASIRRRKQELRIQVLNDVVVMLTRRQIASFVAVFERNLLKSSAPEARAARGPVGESRALVTGQGGEADETVYDRTVVTADARGLVLELLSEDESALVPAAIALITLGPVRCVRDVLSETTPSLSPSATVVAMMMVDVAWLRVDDRRKDVPEAFRLVLNAESGGGVDEDGHNLPFVPSLLLKQHLKRSPSGMAESKTEVRMLSPQLLLRVDLIEALRSFLSASAGEETSVAAPCEVAVAGVQVPAEQDETAASKVSIFIESPQVFAVETPLSDQSRGVDLAGDQIKVSLLLNAAGNLTKGSQVRCRGLELSLCSARTLSGSAQRPSTVGERSRMSMPAEGAAGRAASLLPPQAPRHSIATPGGQGTSVLKCWAFDMETPVVLLRLRVLQVRPPTVVASSVHVSVPSIVLDGTVQDVATLAVITPRLSIFSTSDSGPSQPVLPPVDVLARDIECIVRIPQHRLRDLRLHSGGDGSSVLRAKLAANVHVARNAASVDVEVVGRGVRSYDGQSGVWDRRDVLEPCSFSVGANLSGPTVLSLAVPHPVRVNFSPLIVKTLAHLTYSMRAALTQAQALCGPSPDSPPAPVGTTLPGGRVEASRFACVWNRLEVGIMSENLRVRAALSGIEVRAVIPQLGQVGGELVLRVDHFEVKNEALGRRNNENGRDWSVLLSPAPDIGLQIDRRHLLSLTNGVDRLLLPSPRSPERSQNAASVVPCDRGAQPSCISTEQAAGSRQACGERGAGGPPVFVAVVQLAAPSQHDVEARFGLSGVDVCMDSDALSDLISWAEMLGSTLSAADKLHGHPFKSEPSESGQRHRDSGEGAVAVHRAAAPGSTPTLAVDQRSCRVVVETLGFRFSARAPSSAESSARGLSLWRVAEVVAGSEYVSNIVVCVPKVDVARRCVHLNDATAIVAGEYRSAVLSRTMFFQVVRQAPSLVSLARVGALAYLRRGDAPRRRLAQPERHRVEGLLEVMDDSNAELERRQCIRERASLLDMKAKSGRSSFLLPSTALATGTEVLDIVDDGIISKADYASGVLLFAVLRASDALLAASAGRYKFYVQHATEAALLVTDAQILIIHQVPERVIVEPRLAVSRIEKYGVPLRGKPRLVVHFIDTGADVSQRRQDMLSQFQAHAQSVVPFTLFCRNRQVAEWLSLSLPKAGTRSQNFELPPVAEP
jgi:hypothetical protein